jgi:predicted RNA-binding Zn-ribbon protein involved in translation (DUF1610 family)
MDTDTKRFLKYQGIWLIISLGISFAISFLLPFPISLVAIIGLYVIISYYVRRRQMRMMGMLGNGGGPSFGGSIFGNQKAVQFYCMSCGTKHNERACPNCGSNMTKVGW